MNKLLDFHPVLLSVFFNRLLRLFDKRLLEQNSLGIVATQAAFHHLIDDVLRLAFLQCSFTQNRALLIDLGSIEILDDEAPDRIAGEPIAELSIERLTDADFFSAAHINRVS